MPPVSAIPDRSRNPESGVFEFDLTSVRHLSLLGIQRGHFAIDQNPTFIVAQFMPAPH